MTVNERELAILERLISLVEERSRYYGKAELKFGLLQGEKTLDICAGVIDFLPKGTETAEETRNYGDFILVKKFVEPAEVCTLLRDLVNNRTLDIKAFPAISVKGSLDGGQFMPSMGHYGYMCSEWPAYYYFYRFQEARGYPPRDIPARLEYPLYPDGHVALIDFLGLSTPQPYISDSFIAIVIPDYRVRIRNLNIAGNKVRAEIDSREIPLEKLVAKFYCESDSKRYQSENLPCDKGHAEYEVSREPTLVHAHILDSTTGEDLDNRRFDYRRPDFREGITIERNEGELREIIGRGENVNVEFKQDLSDEFLETVVAFANSSGGTIFLGVRNDGQIVRFERNDDSITNSIASNVEPNVQFKISIFTFKDSRVITIIDIPEGNDKPYSHRERGVYVRKGGTDRHATRTDLEAIYSQRQSSRATPF